jgi:hypothetical protein
MNRAKQLALDALKCPVRHALKVMFEEARVSAWQTREGIRCFVPLSAVAQMKERLAYLRNIGMIQSWELEVEEVSHVNYRVAVLVGYRHNGAKRTAKESWRLW